MRMCVCVYGTVRSCVFRISSKMTNLTLETMMSFSTLAGMYVCIYLYTGIINFFSVFGIFYNLSKQSHCVHACISVSVNVRVCAFAFICLIPN